ncbi:MAG: DHA2 family efflux MFS transporter permease subunit [Deltaproteobacteria bacterium]|nr:DHA2 family efflux MFS transporter permease subunit [Deltaproteobacteria bacterium]MBW1962273.1 DHA2 family efflux MFS transporter permease subunit [Deltaproteobacteria bacterium]MBW2153826.1 DHA2 family efflux MFS transporter permease subunit [Deltaproteobacteria bacterium]
MKAITSDSLSQPRVNKWLVAIAVMVPTFIEVMDISVVNVSLPHIQGSLNAGLDEVTWVLTSYLVSNAIIIPITGWLGGIFGRKRYLLISIIVFTISSLACGAAPTLQVLIVARIFQGLGGGGLQPLSQAILLETFPVAEHGMAMAVFGMGVVLAPILGPVIGGWITDTLSWRWVFYINLPVGFLAICLVTLFVHDPEYIRHRKIYFDKWGLFFLVVGIGCLQIVLDKGQREDWFSSHFIVTLSMMASISLFLFIMTEMRTPHPVVNLRVFQNRNFFVGNLNIFTGFGCMFGSIVLLPLYLQKLMNYTAFWAGLVLGPGGIASFFIMPVTGMMLKKGVNPRNLLVLGLMIMAFSIFLMSGFNLKAGFMEIAIPRLIQGLGLGLFFVPLAAATFVSIPKEQMGNASGIFNLLRNLGGSFGVALSTTVLSQRAQFHQNFLVENVNPYRPAFQIRSEQILGWLETHHAELANPTTVLAIIYRELLRQANMLAFNDTFYLLACLTALLVPLALFLRKERNTGRSE